jgi:hypothetical protein
LPRIKIFLIAVNILGGLAVLGSYVWGFLTFPDTGDILWGGVPSGLRPVYTASMFLAAAGYFAFSTYIFHLKQIEAKVLGRNGFVGFNILYATILVPSALWLPLTILTIGQSSQIFLWLVRFDLLIVAVASLGMLYVLIKVQPRKTIWLHRLAVLGCMAFCFQTVILDAIVWAANFHL